MLLPLAALFTAPYLRYILSFRKGIRFFYPFHLVFAIFICIAILILNFYFFPPRNIFIWVFGTLTLIGLVALIFRKFPNKAEKIIYMTAAFSLVLNFFMNYNFFPSLLKYQAGNELVKKMERENIIIPKEEIVLLEPNAHTFEFTRKQILPLYGTDSFDLIYPQLKDKYFLLSSTQVEYIEAQGFEVKPYVSQPDYNVTTIKMNFLNPATREATLDTLMLAKIYKQ